jgi:hypothetical protein
MHNPIVTSAISSLFRKFANRSVQIRIDDQRTLQEDFASDCTRRCTDVMRFDLGGIDLGGDF